MLTGMVTCGECGGPLHVTHGKNRSYYRERSHYAGRVCRLDGNSWYAKEPDGEVEGILLGMVSDERWHAAMNSVRLTPGAASARAKLEERRTRVIGLHVEGLIDEGESKALLAKLNREIVALPPDIAPLQPLLQRLSGMAEAWEELSPEYRNRLCREMFTDVVLDVESKDVGGIVWKPRPELSALFEARRDWCVGGIGPGRTRTPFCQQPDELLPTGPKDGVIRLPCRELLAAATDFKSPKSRPS